jgi:hypothetical protein
MPPREKVWRHFYTQPHSVIPHYSTHSVIPHSMWNPSSEARALLLIRIEVHAALVVFAGGVYGLGGVADGD